MDNNYKWCYKITIDLEQEKLLGKEKYKKFCYRQLKDIFDLLIITETDFRLITDNSYGYGYNGFYQIEGLVLNENLDKHRQAVKKQKEMQLKLNSDIEI